MKFAASRVTLSCADHGWHHRMPDHENMTIPRTDLTVASLLERVVALENAIEPFARIAGWFDHQRPMHSVITTGNGDITVDDLLVARAVLADSAVLPRGPPGVQQRQRRVAVLREQVAGAGAGTGSRAGP